MAGPLKPLIAEGSALCFPVATCAPRCKTLGKFVLETLLQARTVSCDCVSCQYSTLLLEALTCVHAKFCTPTAVWLQIMGPFSRWLPAVASESPLNAMSFFSEAGLLCSLQATYLLKLFVQSLQPSLSRTDPVSPLLFPQLPSARCWGILLLLLC